MGLFNKNKKVESSCCCGNVEELIVKENQGDGQSNGCGCGGNCDCSERGSDADCNCTEQDKEKNGLVIKVLGSGCKNCITLAENVKTSLEELKLEAEILKVTDFAEITGYGVMSTPALVVNEKVVSYGKVLKPQEVKKILEKFID